MEPKKNNKKMIAWYTYLFLVVLIVIVGLWRSSEVEGLLRALRDVFLILLE